MAMPWWQLHKRGQLLHVLLLPLLFSFNSNIYTYSDKYKQKANSKSLESISAVRHQQTVESIYQRLDTADTAQYIHQHYTHHTAAVIHGIIPQLYNNSQDIGRLLSLSTNVQA